MVLNKKMSGLTMSGMGGLMKLVLLFAGFFPLYVVAMLGGKQVNLKILNDLKTEEEIKKLLGNN